MLWAGFKRDRTHDDLSLAKCYRHSMLSMNMHWICKLCQHFIDKLILELKNKMHIWKILKVLIPERNKTKLLRLRTMSLENCQHEGCFFLYPTLTGFLSLSIFSKHTHNLETEVQTLKKFQNVSKQFKMIHRNFRVIIKIEIFLKEPQKKIISVTFNRIYELSVYFVVFNQLYGRWICLPPGLIWNGMFFFSIIRFEFHNFIDDSVEWKNSSTNKMTMKIKRARHFFLFFFLIKFLYFFSLFIMK